MATVVRDVGSPEIAALSGSPPKAPGSAGGYLLGASGLLALSVRSLHEFVGWFLGRIPSDHSPPANIAIDAAAVSNGQYSVADEVLGPAVRANKVTARGKCWGAHRDILYA